MSSRRPWFSAAAFFVLAVWASGACAPRGGARAPRADEPLGGAVGTPASSAMVRAPVRVEVLPASVSSVGFERMGKYPEPGWHVPRSFRVLPGTKTVVYLASESGDETLSLFAWDGDARSARVLVRAAEVATATPMSREEELRRERRRERAEGITSFRVATRAAVIVLSQGGDVLAYEAGGAGGKVERLTRTPEPEIDPQPCATGARVAFVRKGELVVVDRKTRSETVLTRGATDGLTHGLQDFNGQEEFGEESGFWWSPSCDRLAYLEVDERKVATVPVAGHRAGEADLMMQRYPRPGGTNPSVRLGVVDLASRRTTWTSWVPEQERYLTRVGWTEDGTSLLLQALSRDQKIRALVRVDASSGRAVELARETSKAWVAPSPWREVLGRGEILFTSDVTGHRHLELRRAGEGGLVRALTSGEWDVTSIVAVDPARGRVLFTGTREGPLERHLYEVPLEGGAVTRLTDEHGVHMPVADETGSLVVDVSSARDRLPRVDVLARAAGEAAFVRAGTLAFADDREVSSQGVRVPEFVQVPGPGGQLLSGALLRPRRVVPGGKHPAVLVVYGGPTAQTVMDAWSPRLLWQHLADRGFFVLQVDNRGSTGRGAAFEQLVHGRLGQLELEDQVAAAAWLAAQPGVDGARLGIYGHSYGGFMAAAAMLNAPGRFSAGVASAPVTDWRLYDTAYTERYMGLLSSNAKGYEDADLARAAERLAGKLLLIHANMDENVHYAHTAKLLDALVAAKKPFDLLVLPGERHGYRRPVARAYVNERIATFFATSL